ncbi:protein kinase [Nonomuraea glycinis]|uniref:non-specific serine/threonine protein kinase n=1 Tax=Nonomuraea glycinis TaxID=2047744 RepID=A0A918A5H6_9ACTN|nr:serine/threonine-protein kinase [Nonomuraea glycinis]MCA2178775.1 protein kinase [Nonomuraea glycinis]GGP08017.1 serine/threonine protein kinase [Nonomuraea glycinis]
MSDRKPDGRRIAGRYQLQEPIGKGGMGIVWRAHDELLDRTVAVKEVRYAAALGDEVQLLNRRTMREARAAARFEHPNVIVVHDVIEEDDRPWIVMQLVESRSLGTVIKQDGPLPPRKVAKIGLAVLDALQRAHESGVLHRDVKPENVLLADDGRVVLTDFGIATLETETQLTVTGLAGTPAFIAPERLKGLPARRESDLWSLGATLYTAVEGRSPHERGMALATMHAVLTDEPDPATHAGPLASVIAGLLAKEPVQRLSYEETAQALRRVISYSADRAPLLQESRAPATMVQPAVEDDMPTDPDLAPVPSALPVSPLPETGARLQPATQEPPLPGDYQETELSGSGRRQAVPVIAAVAAVVLVAAVGGYLGLRAAPGDDPTADPRSLAVSTGTSQPSSGASAPPPSSATPSAEPTPSPTATPTDTLTPTEPKATEAALPAGWKLYKDKKLDFTIGLPKGWDEYKREGSQVFFRGPGAGSNAFMAVDRASNPGSDPLADWKKQEKSAKYGFGGYQLLDIKKVDFQKAAADWDFTWNTNTGPTRVRNRGFITDNGRGYSIYWHNLNSRWKKDYHFFETFCATFKPDR